MKRFLYFYKGATYTIYGLVAFSALAIVVVPSLFGYATLRIETASMTPTYPVDSMVVVQKLSQPEQSEVNDGDVVTYRPFSGATTTVTHRVVGTTTEDGQTKLLTKGDANETADSPVKYEQVVGKVKFGVPCLGTLTKPFNIVIMLFVLFALMVGEHILERMNKKYNTTISQVAGAEEG